MSKARGYCLTVNNYDDNDIETLTNIEARYLIIGKEVGENGTPHLQCYIEFENPRAFAGVKKLLPKAHIEKRIATPQQASEYCKKEGDFEEYGDIPSQGKRNDLAAVADDIMAGCTLGDVARKYPIAWIRYNRGLTSLSYRLQEDRKTKPTIHWLWGLAGVGKTRRAMTAPGTTYIKDGTMWWDNYEFQDKIVIDDFDGHWPFRDLLRLMDYNPYQGQVKGGYVKINSGTIYITCEFPPNHYWSGNALKQVLRRLDTVEEVS